MVAEMVKGARRSAGLTQAELAARVGTTQSAIARLERPGSNPRAATLERVLGAMGRGLTTAPAAPAIDEAQVRARLALSPAERLALFQRSQRNLLALLERARRVER